MSAPTIQQVAAFLREHGAGPKVWPEAAVMPWLQWHWKNGGVGVVHAAGEIRAVAVARCIERLGQAEEPYAHEETSPILWCDEIASVHPDGIIHLMNLARQRFGPRIALVGRVFGRTGKHRLIPWKTVEKLTQHLS